MEEEGERDGMEQAGPREKSPGQSLTNGLIVTATSRPQAQTVLESLLDICLL